MGFSSILCNFLSDQVDRSYPSQTLVTLVAMAVGWLKVWDEALDRGPIDPQAAMQNCVYRQKMSCGTMQ